jgi:hypothetical protein
VTLPRRRKTSFRNVSQFRPANFYLVAKRIRQDSKLRPTNSGRLFLFQSPMHVSSYLMIAALVLMGLQLAYAFYQLASFVL